MTTTEEYKERFMKRVEMIPECGCWIWMGGAQGPNLEYGSFSYEGKSSRAHRISYLLHKGEFDKSLDVLHKCDITLCVNPDHLFLGNQSDNMLDMSRKGRRKGNNFTKEQASYHGKMSGFYRKRKAENLLKSST